MVTTHIPPDIQAAAKNVIERFNHSVLKGAVLYLPRFKGAFLYLDREDFGSAPAEICRLRYTGSMDNWKFAIFKHSTNRYDPTEFMFPGAGLLDGTLEGALRCGMQAYPA